MLNVGDRVVLSESGIDMYNPDRTPRYSSNPVGVEGTLTAVGSRVGHSARVDWDNNFSNSYSLSELSPVSLESQINNWLEENT